ncbi:hypothetical protein ACSSS7_002557 [Eimeria intestinalis]
MAQVVAPSPAPITIQPVAELLPQTESLKALVQRKKEQELLQQQEEGERLQDERLRALELRRQDEHQRRSKLQRKLLRDAQEQQRREEEGRSRQDPTFLALLRQRHVYPFEGPGGNHGHWDDNGQQDNALPQQFAVGACGLSPVHIRLLLREALIENNNVEELDMSRVSLTDDDGPGICGALRLLKSLRTVSLEGNHLGLSTAVALRKALENNTTLQSLSLGGCRFGGPQGIEELARALRNNKSLKHLSLRGMQIDPAGGEVLLESLRYNQTLESLDMCDNDLTAEQQQKVADLVATNRRRCESLREREQMERALMSREEDATVAFLMQQEALRLEVEGLEGRRLARESANFAAWEQAALQRQAEHGAAVEALQQASSV